jgi:hypothetical protein
MTFWGNPSLYDQISVQHKMCFTKDSAGLNPSENMEKLLRPDTETWEEKHVRDIDLITL